MLKVAVQSGRYQAMAKLPNGMLITKQKAIDSGYTIAKDEADAASIKGTAGDLSGAGNAYLDRLLALPEAKERPLAASRIARQHTSATMPVAKAALFLSGLPIETADVAEAPLRQITPEADTKLRRKVEIHLLGLDRQAMHGDRDAKSEAMKIRYGLEIHQTSRMQCVYALQAAGVDLHKLSDNLRN